MNDNKRNIYFVCRKNFFTHTENRKKKKKNARDDARQDKNPLTEWKIHWGFIHEIC